MNNKFNIGDIVYLIHDTEQLPRMVTGINVRSNGLIYLLNLGITESFHYDFEISTQEDVLKKVK